MFRRRVRIALALAVLLCACAALVRVRLQKSASTVQVAPDVPESGSAFQAEGKNNSGLEARATGARKPPARPAGPPAFWPQQAHPIAFKSRVLEPSLDFPADAGIEQTHVTIWVVQFGGPLSEDTLAALRNRGIDVLFPTSACAFHVRASYRTLSAAAKTFNAPRILGWVLLEPADKLLAAVRSNVAQASGLRHGTTGGDARPTFRLEIYPRADLNALASKLDAAGAQVLSHAENWVEAAMPPDPDSALKLAAIEDVYAVGFPPPRKRAYNEQAAMRSNITPMQSAPRNLSGTGLTVLVRDDGAAFNHPDFGSRLVLGPDVLSAPVVLHTTHVAGTIGGTGLADPAALAKGMAPACQMVVMDINGSDKQEPLDAKTQFGAVISNHSYGFITGWDNGVFNNNQNTFGVYETFARDWDAIVKSDGLIMVKAVGNDRNDSGPGFPHDGTQAADGEFYDCVDASSTGKNILTVGAAQDFVQAGTPFGATCVLASSSSGPTDDGRLRPELVANGDAVTSCNTSSTPGLEYMQLSGTSMSCAVVCGAATLMSERFRQVFGNNAIPLPHFLRALFAHTATDLGRPGPDYLHGFGMLDLSAAVTLLDTDGGAGNLIVSRSLNAAAPERFFELTSDGLAQIKATVCWTDDMGDLLAANAIVNDLDLRLVRVRDQALLLPFKLDRARPEQNAVNALNTADTIEQLILNGPEIGKYLLAVRGTTLASDTNFTLVSSHALTEVLPPSAVISSSSTTGQPPFTVTFDGSASSDPDGVVVQFLWDFGDGTQTQGPLVQHTYGPGNFQATLTVVDSQGASASAGVIIAVNNTPPVAMAAVTPPSGPPPLNCMFTSAGSSDLEAPIVSFDWDFGDGTSAQGAVVSHTYSTAGLYFATLTVTDNGGATARQQVNVLVGQPLIPASSRFNLNFAKPGVDRFSLSATVPVAPDLTTSGLTGSVRLGSVEYSFTLDDRGRYKIAPLNIILTPSRSKLKVTLAKTNLAPALSAFGATSRDVESQFIRVPFAFSLDDGTVFGATGLPYSYSAKQGKSGKGKLIVP